MKYIVSKDLKSGLWYAHLEGFSHVPVAGSLSKQKSTAKEYAKMMNWLPNRVEEIEKRRKKEWESEYCDC